MVKIVECSICLGTIPKGHVKALNFKNNNLKQVEKLACGHFFHKICISRWEEIASSCPSCRHVIKPHKNEWVNQYHFPQSVVDAINFADLLGIEILRDNMTHEEMKELEHLDVIGTIIKTLANQIFRFSLRYL